MEKEKREVLNQKIEDYLLLDSGCIYVRDSFYNKHDFGTEDELFKRLFSYESNDELDVKMDELEEALLNWLGWANPRNRKFNGVSGTQIGLYFDDGISIQINNGIFYFEKTFGSKDGMKSDRTVEFAIVYPEMKKYYNFCSSLEKMVLDSFVYRQESEKVLTK